MLEVEFSPVRSLFAGKYFDNQVTLHGSSTHVFIRRLKKASSQSTFFNSRSLNGSCILLAGLSGLRHLTLTATGITDRIISSILQASSKLVELHLTGTQISELCVPDIIGLGKLRYIAFPPEDVCGFSKRGVLAIVKGCPSLRTLECQESYFFDKEEITKIVSNNCQLTGLIIPYAFIDDNMFMFVIESLRNLKHICVCETSIMQASVGQREKQEAVSRHLLEGEPFTVIAELQHYFSCRHIYRL